MGKEEVGPIKGTVNDFLRLGLSARREARCVRRFAVRARELGIRDGLDYDDVGGLLEQLEGLASSVGVPSTRRGLMTIGE